MGEKSRTHFTTGGKNYNLIDWGGVYFMELCKTCGHCQCFSCDPTCEKCGTYYEGEESE